MKSILDQLDAAEKAATPGNWVASERADFEHDFLKVRVGALSTDEWFIEFAKTAYSKYSDGHIDCWRHGENADLVVLMRNNIRALIEVARAAETTLAQYIKIVEGGPIIPANDIGQLSKALHKLRIDND